MVTESVWLLMLIFGTNNPENNMNIFSHKYMSLACAYLNFIFAFMALTSQSWLWFIFSIALGVFCYNNYKKAS